MTQPAFKLAVVVDNTLPAGLAANAAAVMTLTLGHRYGDRLIGPDLADRSNTVHPGITTVPVPILTADPERIKGIKEAADTGNTADTTVINFTDCALQTRTYDDYATRLRATSHDRLTYHAIAICGPRKDVQRLTGSLPLLR